MTAEPERIPIELQRVLSKPHSTIFLNLAIFLRDVLEQLPPESAGACALFSLAESIYFSAPEIAMLRVRDAAGILNQHFGEGDPVITPAWQAMLVRMNGGNLGTAPAAN